MGTHNRRVEAVFFNIARVSDDHVAHHAQTLDIGIERADAVGQVFRQHGNHAAREVNAGAAFLRVRVDSVIGADIMADIGNRHDQTVIASDFFGKHGIVEIARRFAVYGDQRQIAQIDAAFQIAFTNMVGDFFRSFGTRLAELVRQMVFAHSNFDFHTAVGIIAQYFDDFRHSRAVLLGISLDFADDDLTGFGFEMCDAIRFQDDTLIQAFVFRFQNRHASIHIETTDHFALRAFDNI